MTTRAESSMAPDMGRLLIDLPGESIVLLSWIVSEYDGLGFVKSECPVDPSGVRDRRWRVSLFFPGEKRGDVLELLAHLGEEGLSLSILDEETPSGEHTEGKGEIP